MTVIQSLVPTTPQSPRVGQATTERIHSETFGVSMLLALLVPPGTPGMPLREQLTTSELNTDPTSQDERAGDQPSVVREVNTGLSQEAVETRQWPRAVVSVTDPVPTPIVKTGPRVPTGPQPTPDRSSCANSPAAPSVEPDVDGLPSKGQPVTATDRTLAGLIDEVPAAPEALRPTETPRSVSAPPVQRAPTGEPIPQITVESVEVSNGRSNAGIEPVPLPSDAPEMPGQSIAQQKASSQPRATAEPGAPAPVPTPQNGNATTPDQSQAHATVQRTPSEGEPAQSSDSGAASDGGRGLAHDASEMRQPHDSLASPQRRATRPVSTVPNGGQHIRERMVVRTADARAARVHAGEGTELTDQLKRQTGEGGGAEQAEHDGQSRVKFAGNRSSLGGVPYAMEGGRTTGGFEKLAGQRPASGQVEQSILRTPLEEPGFVSRPEDRATLRFTDHDGVEGRLRVAVRGQAVRATIVSGDPATAERIGSGVSEIQRALNKQGFNEAQITVQHARGTNETGSLAVASGFRPTAETVSGTTAARTFDEQANRERQHGGPRDQQHNQNSGRSQQRSRERQER